MEKFLINYTNGSQTEPKWIVHFQSLQTQLHKCIILIVYNIVTISMQLKLPIPTAHQYHRAIEYCSVPVQYLVPLYYTVNHNIQYKLLYLTYTVLTTYMPYNYKYSN